MHQHYLFYGYLLTCWLVIVFFFFFFFIFLNVRTSESFGSLQTQNPNAGICVSLVFIFFSLSSTQPLNIRPEMIEDSPFIKQKRPTHAGTTNVMQSNANPIFNVVPFDSKWDHTCKTASPSSSVTAPLLQVHVRSSLYNTG